MDHFAAEGKLPQGLKLRFSAFLQEYTENGADTAQQTTSAVKRQGAFIVIEGPLGGTWTSNLAPQDDLEWPDQVIELESLCTSLQQLITIRLWETNDGRTSSLFGENVIRVKDILDIREDTPLDLSIPTGVVCERKETGIIHFTNSDLLNEKLESVLREYEKKEAVTAILNSLKMHTDTTSATATNGVTAGASQLSNHEESSTVVPEASTKFNLTEALARANREIKLRQQISQEKQYLSERVSELENHLKLIENEKLRMGTELQELLLTKDTLQKTLQKKEQQPDAGELREVVKLYSTILRTFRIELGESLFRSLISKYVTLRGNDVQTLCAEDPGLEELSNALHSVKILYGRSMGKEEEVTMEDKMAELEDKVNKLDNQLTDERNNRQYYQYFSRQLQEEMADLMPVSVRTGVLKLNQEFRKTKTDWKDFRENVSDTLDNLQVWIDSTIAQVNSSTVRIKEPNRSYSPNKEHVIQELRQQVQLIRQQMQENQEGSSKRIDDYNKTVEALQESNKEKDEVIDQWEVYASHWEERGRVAEQRVEELEAYINQRTE